MALLQPMPQLVIPQTRLAEFGTFWTTNGGSLGRKAPYAGQNLVKIVDEAVGAALAEMLGGIPVVSPKQDALLPAQSDCVEVGPAKIVGGVRPQNYDVVYRPDGVRFAFDSKSLNSKDSIGQNWNNMVNDISTECTLHSRYPQAVVAFVVMFPESAMNARQRLVVVGTLERLARRVKENDPEHQAEAIALVVWKPDGTISSDVPPPGSPIRIEEFSPTVEARYRERYAGMPPHADI